MHALITAATLLVGVGVAAFIWWELHRHRAEIARALSTDVTVGATRAELVEGAATGLLFAAVIVAALVL